MGHLRWNFSLLFLGLDFHFNFFDLKESTITGDQTCCSDSDDVVVVVVDFLCRYIFKEKC